MHTDPPTYTHSLKVISLIFLVCLQFYVSCHVRPAVEFSTCAVTSVLKSVWAFQISTQELLYICACTHTCMTRMQVSCCFSYPSTSWVVCSRSPGVYHSVIIDYFCKRNHQWWMTVLIYARSSLSHSDLVGGGKELLNMKAILQLFLMKSSKEVVFLRNRIRTSVDMGTGLNRKGLKKSRSWTTTQNYCR